MKEMKRDMMRIQQLVGEAFNQTGALVALSDGGHMNPNRIQKTLDQTMGQFEASTLELRKLCERYATGIGGYKTRPVFPIVNATGYVEELGFGWLHIVLKTLLPHCRYQTPAWLSDTIHRLLDEYENSGRRLPYFQNALLVIDEHSCIEGRHVFDQDNKGWKAISNAIKGDSFRMMTNTRCRLHCSLKKVWKMYVISHCWTGGMPAIFLRHTQATMQ